MTSPSMQTQRLPIDYSIHYMKKGGGVSEKEFKWTGRELGPGETLTVEKNQTIRDYSTRKHYPGKHQIEVMVNGEMLAKGTFRLTD